MTTKLLTLPPGFSDLPTALQLVHDDHFIDFHYQDLWPIYVDEKTQPTSHSSSK